MRQRGKRRGKAGGGGGGGGGDWWCGATVKNASVVFMAFLSCRWRALTSHEELANQRDPCRRCC